MFPFIFDWTMVFMIPAIALTFWAQWKVKATYRKYSEVRSRSGLTGEQVARRILDTNGIHNVRVEPVAGELTDHYHPTEKVVRLSENIFGSNSLAALAIAAHECGHAVQDAVGYKPMNLRAALVPAANLGSTLAIPLLLVGMFIPSISWVMDIGIAFFAAAVLFHLVTLPVEFDASARAVKILANGGYLAPDEVDGSKKVLDAAAWTYIAAATVALLQLIRLIVLRNSRD